MVMEGGPGMTSHTALLMVLQQDAPSLAWVMGQPDSPLPAASLWLKLKAQVRYT